MASLFAEKLRVVLDEFDNRSFWADVIGATPSEIEDWLNDVAIPETHHLSMILTVIEVSIHGENVKKAVDDFNLIANMRATKTSPLGALMLPTIQEYMARPAFCDLSRKLAKMDDVEKMNFLLVLYPEVRVS